MKTAYETKLRIIVMVLAIAPAQVSAKINNCNDIYNSIEYLDENVVFCLSEDGLSTYIDMAEVFDLDGMNYLVGTGECNFVPTGKFLLLQNYESKILNSVPVIAIDIKDLTLWTFRKLVSEGSPEELDLVSDNSAMLAFVKNDQRTGQCR